MAPKAKKRRGYQTDRKQTRVTTTAKTKSAMDDQEDRQRKLEEKRKKRMEAQKEKEAINKVCEEKLNVARQSLKRKQEMEHNPSDSSSEEDGDESVRGYPWNVSDIKHTDGKKIFDTGVHFPRVSVDEQLKCKADRVEEMLVKYISGEVFPVLKFVGPSHLLAVLRAAEYDNNYIDFRGEIPDDVFEDHFKGKVSTVFSKMRHKTQCLARMTFLRESRNDEVPPDFPDGILQEREGYKGEAGEAKYTVHPDYRQKDTDAWRYFATKYLPCVNAKITNFKNKSHKQLICEIFTASDEAYALSLLINEYENYKFTLVNPLGESVDRPKKPFTNSRSGKSSGWNNSGLETYKSLIEQVVGLREQNVSIELEHKLLSVCKTQSGRVGPPRKKHRNVEEFDLLSTLSKDSKVYKILASSCTTTSSSSTITSTTCGGTTSGYSSTVLTGGTKVCSL